MVDFFNDTSFSRRILAYLSLIYFYVAPFPVSLTSTLLLDCDADDYV